MTYQNNYNENKIWKENTINKWHTKIITICTCLLQKTRDSSFSQQESHLYYYLAFKYSLPIQVVCLWKICYYYYS